MSIGLDEETAEKGAVAMIFQVNDLQFRMPPASTSEVSSKIFRCASDMLYRTEVIHTFFLGEAPKAFSERDMRHMTPETLASMKAHGGKH